ncbi:MAG TPA: glycoside hydrolase family 2 TIM barrel-domain containing protein [Terracidiphilus sp.]|nr:glycoside hydrolase family 2 TIM barrel-domain containing protein [Terracidiphilus sp.]
MHSRRKFIQVLSTGVVALARADAAAPENSTAGHDDVQSAVLALRDGWEFHLDPAGAMEAPEDGAWESIQVPHTWQSLGRSPEYTGVAWYRLRFDAPASWASQHVGVEFEAVNHSAHVFLNGREVGQHIGKGYTAFTVDLSPHLKVGEQNTLLVRIDNRPGDRMLPRNQSYDWTDDGGIIRAVNLLVRPTAFIERIEIDATADLARQSAEIRIRAVVRNAASKSQRVSLTANVRREAGALDLISLAPVGVDLEADTRQVVELGPVSLNKPALWHFDSPHLYVASVEAASAAGIHTMVENFGIRRFEVRGAAFYLNGEKISLIGVERMAGSHPELGFAETLDWIESNHRDMKRLNCVFTRVHWAQDRRVLDFCDRHGILFQEEVPAWGPETFRETSDEVQRALEQNGLEQLREMIARDRNHPCIVSWGLCNEVDGKIHRSRQFAHALSEEARKLDPSRLQTYASHTLGNDPAADMAGDFDFISTNEYYGSWAPGGPSDVRAHLDRIRKAFPNKPIVVSEYGWCECQPTIKPGDENRVDIVNSHTEVFREFPEVAGAIYFDYNDYRTLVGDKGKGAMRQRVHGVVDLYGAPKGSFEALRRQCSPIQAVSIRKSAEFEYTIEVRTRQQLPAYTLRDYSLRWVAHGYDDLPMDGGIIPLPALAPGSSRTLKAIVRIADVRRIVVDVLRPTGFSAFTVEHSALEGPR